MGFLDEEFPNGWARNAQVVDFVKVDLMEEIGVKLVVPKAMLYNGLKERIKQI